MAPIAALGCALQLVSMTANADSEKPLANASPAGTVLEDRGVRREVVNFRDLDLSSPEGMRTMEARIERSVDSVCPDSGRTGISQAQARRECKAASLADAMAQVHALAATANLTARALDGCEDATRANDAVAHVNGARVHGDDAAR